MSRVVTPNAALSMNTWGGINAPTPPQPKNRTDAPPLKQYPIEQVLFFHERHLQQLMGAVGQLQLDASKNAQSPTETASVDIEAIKKSVKSELSTQFTTQNEKIENQQKAITNLRQEIIDLKKNLKDNVELVVEEA